MAWTSPKTFVAGNALTAAELNEQLRDNEIWLKAALATIGQTSDSASGSLKSAMCGVRSTRGTDLSVTDTTWTSIPFTGEDFDTANGAASTFHSNSVNPERLTVPSGLDGYYRIWANVIWDTNSTGQRALRLIRNGTGTVAIDRTSVAGGTTATAQTLAVTILMAAGEYITCDAWQNSGGTRTIDGSFANLPAFGMERVGV